MVLSMLACANGLISDCSSILVDYVATRKPMAVTVGSKANCSRGTTMLVDVLYEGYFRIKNEENFMRFRREMPGASWIR